MKLRFHCIRKSYGLNWDGWKKYLIVGDYTTIGDASDLVLTNAKELRWCHQLNSEQQNL